MHMGYGNGRLDERFDETRFFEQKPQQKGKLLLKAQWSAIIRQQL